MSFKPFGEAVQLRFMEMSEGELFVVKADDIFERYLAAFPPGSNPMYRVRTEHDCQCCKQFIRRLGVVVGIKEGKVITVWGGHDLPHPYKQVADALHEYVSSLPIESVFRTKEPRYGLDHNYDRLTSLRHDHFVGEVDAKHFDAKDADTKRGEKAAVYQVFQRGLKEIRLCDLAVVLDLISSNALYKGEEFKPAIQGFEKLMQGYVLSGNSDLFIWENLNNRFAQFRNTAIGSLFTDLAEGKDLDPAVRAYESKVAPANYKRPTAVYTPKMMEQAVKDLHEANLTGMTQRRYARISDISVNNVLFVDNDVRHQLKDGLTALLESGVTKATPYLKYAVPVTAEAFVKDLLPGSKSVEVFVENRHCGNFVSLTGGDGPERPFKWPNNFAWSYEGDTTDSVKERVKAAGGKIDADLNVRLSWFNLDDLDLHGETPYGHIHYANKGYPQILDVDMNAGMGRTRTPVENLSFNNLRTGTYNIFVNQFNKRESIDCGFNIEVEHGGVLRQFSYTKPMRNQENVIAMQIVVNERKGVTITSPLDEGNSSQDKWGVKTQTLVPVTIIAYSPNYWGEQTWGPKHLIFGLRGCANPKPTRGIYNEYLRSDLDKHRKVLEMLGEKTKCKPTDDQVSGVGFSAARGDTVTVVVDGRRAYTLSF